MRKFGWLPDHPDSRDKPLGAIMSASSPPESATLRPYVGDILNQGNLSSCVAHAIAYAIRIAHSRAGIKNPTLLSREFIYWNARKYDGSEQLDNGTMIRSGVKALNKFGFCPESAWEYDEFKVNDQPSWEAYREATDQRFELYGNSAQTPIGYYRIGSEGASKVDDVKRAISAGYPVVFGTALAQEFVDNGAKRIWTPPDPSYIIGRHALCGAEYDSNGLRGPNSWTNGWGDDGYYCLSWEYIEWEETLDLWAIKAAPAYREGV